MTGACTKIKESERSREDLLNEDEKRSVDKRGKENERIKETCLLIKFSIQKT